MKLPIETIKLLKEVELKSKDVERILNLMEKPSPLDKFLTRNPTCLEMKNKVRCWALVDDPVLITGETGTGKELIAQALHGNRSGKFVPVNCAGFIANEGLMESILFGHVKGSFTGAFSNTSGLVGLSNNGTLFLDEIAELPVYVQSKLLRLIQEGTYRPLGGLEELSVKTRIICATKENIENLVKQGKFRDDLYYRISVGRIHIPPLHERPEDIKLLLEHFFGGEIPEDFEVPSFLPGNVRMLHNLVRRYIVEKKSTIC